MLLPIITVIGPLYIVDLDPLAFRRIPLPMLELELEDCPFQRTWWSLSKELWGFDLKTIPRRLLFTKRLPDSWTLILP